MYLVGLDGTFIFQYYSFYFLIDITVQHFVLGYILITKDYANKICTQLHLNAVEN